MTCFLPMNCSVKTNSQSNRKTENNSKNARLTSKITLELLNLTDNAYLVLKGARSHFRKRWFSSFTRLSPRRKEDENSNPVPGCLASFSNLTHLHPASVRSMGAKLQAVAKKGYIHHNKALSGILDSLENGMPVVVNFGCDETDMDLILVSNILSCLIRSRWGEITSAHKSGKEHAPPTPLTVPLYRVGKGRRSGDKLSGKATEIL